MRCDSSIPSGWILLGPSGQWLALPILIWYWLMCGTPPMVTYRFVLLFTLLKSIHFCGCCWPSVPEMFVNNIQITGLWGGGTRWVWDCHPVTCDHIVTWHSHYLPRPGLCFDLCPRHSPWVAAPGTRDQLACWFCQLNFLLVAPRNSPGSVCWKSFLENIYLSCECRENYASQSCYQAN